MIVLQKQKLEQDINGNDQSIVAQAVVKYILENNQERVYVQTALKTISIHLFITNNFFAA